MSWVSAPWAPHPDVHGPEPITPYNVEPRCSAPIIRWLSVIAIVGEPPCAALTGMLYRNPDATIRSAPPSPAESNVIDAPDHVPRWTMRPIAKLVEFWHVPDSQVRPKK